MPTITNKATLDSTGFTKGMDKMEGKVKGFSKSLGSVKRGIAGAFAGGAIASMANQALTAADNIDNLSKQLGLGIETTQSLKVVFEEAGLGVEGLNTTMAKLIEEQAKAINGNEDSIKSFEAFGLSMEEVKKKSPEELLETISGRLDKVDTNAEAAEAMFKLLGARSAKMKEALKLAAKDGFGGLNDQMKESGRIMKEEVVKNLDEMEERFARQKQKIAAAGATGLSKGITGIENVASVLGSLSAGGSVAEGILSAQGQEGMTEEGVQQAEETARMVKRGTADILTLGLTKALRDIGIGGKDKQDERARQMVENQKETNKLLKQAVSKDGSAVL